MLGLYSGLYDGKRVRRRDGEAGDGCVKRWFTVSLSVFRI